MSNTLTANVTSLQVESTLELDLEWSTHLYSDSNMEIPDYIPVDRLLVETDFKPILSLMGRFV